MTLFGGPEWQKHWQGMPEYRQEDLLPWKSVTVHFEDALDMERFAQLVEQTVSDKTKSIWFPKQDQGDDCRTKRFVGSADSPRYPVYVISKGRWDKPLTAAALERAKVPFYIVVEPQERKKYEAVVDPGKILTLPFSNLGQGSIPARNWVWEHALSSGAARHWILDDNLYRFLRLHRNRRVVVRSPALFCAAEDFVDRYENVGLSGFNYDTFVHRRDKRPPYTLNTRIYSCILIRNDLPHRWRGRYNEDTDLSLRVLKDGLCTVLFNAFICKKVQTMTMKGGNTDELYAGDGRLDMAKSLQEQHPDVTSVTRKWGRWQHHVDYSRFRRNQLKPKIPLSAESPVEYGMVLQKKADGRWVQIDETKEQ